MIIEKASNLIIVNNRLVSIQHTTKLTHTKRLDILSGEISLSVDTSPLEMLIVKRKTSIDSVQIVDEALWTVVEILHVNDRLGR